MISEKNYKFDLEERTIAFGIAVIKFCKDKIHDSILKIIITQLIRSATSIGANYMEADGASSRKDFRCKIFICKKEAQETKYWFRILASEVESSENFNYLNNEIRELVLIFQRISMSLTETKPGVD